jgi:hypothetical protein
MAGLVPAIHVAGWQTRINADLREARKLKAG